MEGNSHPDQTGAGFHPGSCLGSRARAWRRFLLPSGCRSPYAASWQGRRPISPLLQMSWLPRGRPPGQIRLDVSNPHGLRDRRDSRIILPENLSAGFQPASGGMVLPIVRAVAGDARASSRSARAVEQAIAQPGFLPAHTEQDSEFALAIRTSCSRRRGGCRSPLRRERIDASGRQPCVQAGQSFHWGGNSVPDLRPACAPRRRAARSSRVAAASTRRPSPASTTP